MSQEFYKHFILFQLYLITFYTYIVSIVNHLIHINLEVNVFFGKINLKFIPCLYHEPITCLLCQQTSNQKMVFEKRSHDLLFLAANSKYFFLSSLYYKYQWIINFIYLKMLTILLKFHKYLSISSIIFFMILFFINQEQKPTEFLCIFRIKTNIAVN